MDAVSPAPKFRAESRRLMRLPPGVGRDLIEVLYGGWLDDEYESLWEKYHDLRDHLYGPGWHAHDANAERRLYAETARRSECAMRMVFAMNHGGTPFRLASAVISELSGAMVKQCSHCKGCGQKRAKSGGGKCLMCRGTGVLGPSTSSRAMAAGCRYSEFNRNLSGAYMVVLTGLRRELDRALALYWR